MDRSGTADRHEWRQLALVLVLFALGAVIALTIDWRATAPRSVTLTAGIAAAFFVTRLLTIRLPQGDEVQVTLFVGLVGLALLSVPLLALAAVLAGLADVLARFSLSTRQQSIHRLLDTVRGAAVVAMMAPWQPMLRAFILNGGTDRVILWTIAAAVTYSVVDVVTMAAQQSVGGHSLLHAVGSLARPLGMVYVVHIPMAAVALRLNSGSSAAWSFPAALLLTLILQNSFNLYLRIRRAYAETIGALAHAAELGTPRDSGHARRVADLAVAVGRRMGLSSIELERLGYAALLHDIGRMARPVDGRDDTHGPRGAEMISSIPFLQDVAPIIGWTPDGERPAPLAWTIVTTCSEYDRLRGEVGALGALDQLVPETATDSGRVREVLWGLVSGQAPIAEAGR